MGKLVDIARPGIKVRSQLASLKNYVGKIVAVVEEEYNSRDETVNFTVSIEWDNNAYTQTITMQSGKAELIYDCIFKSMKAHTTSPFLKKSVWALFHEVCQESTFNIYL